MCPSDRVTLGQSLELLLIPVGALPTTAKQEQLDGKCSVGCWSIRVSGQEVLLTLLYFPHKK